MSDITPGYTWMSGATVTPSKLNDMIALAAISPEAVTADKLAANSVTTAKIPDANVTAAKLAGGITADKLDGSVGANPWASKTSAYAALPGDRISANTAGGTFAVALPANPTANCMVTVCDPANSWKTNNLTVSRNGSTIEGLAEDLSCNVSGKMFSLIYTGTTWRIY